MPSSDRLKAYPTRVGVAGRSAGGVQVGSLADWCRVVVGFAETGLNRQGEDAAFLLPFREVLASGRSPGEMRPGGVAEVIAVCEDTEGESATS